MNSEVVGAEGRELQNCIDIEKGKTDVEMVRVVWSMTDV